MAKHTKGPWAVHNDCVFAGPFKKIKGGISGYRAEICSMEDMDLSAAEVKANARLIAAAPELLEALVDLFANGAGISYANWTTAQHAAHDAIARATGATP